MLIFVSLKHKIDYLHPCIQQAAISIQLPLQAQMCGVKNNKKNWLPIEMYTSHFSSIS